MPDNEPPRSLEEALVRIAQLEQGFSGLRHDVRGLLSVPMLLADTIREHADPKVARVGTRMNDVIAKIIERLDHTRELVPPRQNGSEN